MRNLILVFITSLSAPALAKPVLVQGFGESKQEAREDAYRLATEKYCGVNVLNDRAYKNENVAKNDLSVYSSCRIKNSKIIKEEEYEYVSPKYRLVLEVEIEQAREADRLFSQSSQENKFDNHKVTAQVESYKIEKREGDKYLNQILSDYPYKAFNVLKADKPYFTTDNYRNVFLVVPYRVQWNYNYVLAFKNTLEKFSDKQKWYELPQDLYGPGKYVLKLSWTNTNSIFKNNQHEKTFVFSDTVKFLDIANHMNSHEPMLRLKVYDVYGNIVIDSCTDITTNRGYAISSNFANYYSGVVGSPESAERFVSFNTGKLQIDPTKITNSSFEIVTQNMCTNFKRSQAYSS